METSCGATRPSQWRIALGWLAVGLNAASACLWAFWGGIEAFHEGWWHGSLGENVLWTLAYLAPTSIFVFLGLVGVLWPRIGAIVILAFTIWFWWWWGVPGRLASGGGSAFVGLVMSGTGGLFAVLWWFGRPVPRPWALLATWTLPLMVAVVSGAEPAWRVAHRVDDGGRGERVIEGNGVTLTWAPEGPGWPSVGAAWDDAVRIAGHVSEDGARVLESPQDVWRLPTRDEAVRSMVRRGRNAGGRIDAGTARAVYRERPDKETPLWNPRSEVIYWWTADEADEGHAWSITYGGMLVKRPKAGRMGSLGFRLVRRW